MIDCYLSYNQVMSWINYSGIYGRFKMVLLPFVLFCFVSRILVVGDLSACSKFSSLDTDDFW